MNNFATIGITNDFFDSDGHLIIPGPGLGLLEADQSIHYQIFPELKEEATVQQIADCDMVFTISPRFSKRTVEGNRRLLCVHRNGSGYDMIDVPALTAANILLCNTQAAVRRPVAVAILTFILSLSTRLLLKNRLARESRWDEVSQHLGIGLTGKILGVIGAGSIGHEFLQLAKPLGMKHLVSDPYVDTKSLIDVEAGMTDLDSLLSESDYVVVCCPLNEKTTHLLGETELSRMKKTSFLINVARGPVIDENALIKALNQGWIRGAGIDVFEEEPPSKENPLLSMENVIVTPHALAQTDESFTSMWSAMIDQARRIVHGEAPAGMVNPEVWNTEAFHNKLAKLRSRLNRKK
jgi:D-3-phosphoglycerate dehydrogenase